MVRIRTGGLRERKNPRVRFKVEAKRALSREEQQTTARPGSFANVKAVGASVGGNIRTKKIFVGGLPSSLTEEGFSQYFQAFGAIEDVVVMSDGQTRQPRGFGFITFASEDSVDKAMEKTFHELNGKLVEVKRALPKEANLGNAGGSLMSGSGTYQSYSGSGGSTSSYEGRMHNNRSAQPQSTGGGHPAYSASGYGAAGFGYGPGNSGVGYGGYGAGGYGSAGSRVPSGAYGNPNAYTTGYVSGPAGVPRSPWNNQPSAGYGFAGFGANASWNPPVNGIAATAQPTSQSPSGAAGYGSQAYGYGGYAGTVGPYGSQGGYGIVAGRDNTGPNNTTGSSGDQGSATGYPGSSYGNQSGYLTLCMEEVMDLVI